MSIYDYHLCRAMDELHYAHYDIHRKLWDESIYEFLNLQYRRLFEKLALTQPGRPIVLHYVGPGLNYPCLNRSTWEPIATQIEEVHIYDIDQRVLDVVRHVIPKVLQRSHALRVEPHLKDITLGMGHALLSWVQSLRVGVARLKVPDAGFFEMAISEDGHYVRSPTAHDDPLTLVISEMAVSSTGLGVFWDLYDNPEFSLRGITPSFVNVLEQVYNTCVARQHLQWISRITNDRGMAIVSADIERIYLGGVRSRHAPAFACPLKGLIRDCNFEMVETAEAIWQDIPMESDSGIPPHVHRVVCCTATASTILKPPFALCHADRVGPVGHGC